MVLGRLGQYEFGYISMLGGFGPGTSAKIQKTLKKWPKMGRRPRFRDSPAFLDWVGSGGVPIYTIPNFMAIGVREHRQNGQKPFFESGFWANFRFLALRGPMGAF